MKSGNSSIDVTQATFNMREPFYAVIQSKIPKHAEIIVNMFDHCNMKCVFCPQDHDDTTGMSRDEIMSKISPIIHYIETNPSPEFHLHIMGGELFQDHLIQQGFLDYYAEFMYEIERKAPPTKTIRFYIITNLVFKETSPVINFCKKHNIKIAISYDPVGRFNSSQLDVFKRNVELFKPLIRVISLTITKRSIGRIIEGDDYFDYLYDNFPCDWDHLLVGSDNLKPMMPAESDLLAFYKVLIDRYPECINISTFTEEHNDKSTHHTMPCTRGNSFTIFSDNSTPKGCSGAVILKHNETKDLGGVDIIHNFMDSRDCFHCEFYKRCTFSCFVHNDYKEMVRDVDGCVFKEAFKYADAKKEKCDVK